MNSHLSTQKTTQNLLGQARKLPRVAAALQSTQIPKQHKGQSTLIRRSQVGHRASMRLSSKSFSHRSNKENSQAAVDQQSACIESLKQAKRTTLVG